ncbi:hypothetical protein Tco_1329499 [Tanacetum coccineum]
MPTKIELVPEQTQQGASDEVLVSIEEVEEWKINVQIKGVKKETLHTVRKKPGIIKPKIDEKARFELKGQFLKELCDNTFSGSDNEDANEHIEKVLEIVDLFHILKVTQDQIML